MRQAGPQTSSLSLDRHRVCGRAEQLVGVGFRCWLAGFKTGDIALWQRAWVQFVDVLGPAEAGAVSCELSQWVRALRDHSRRELEVLKPSCRQFCRDECLAMSLVAAYQHNACPAIRACAMTLLGCNPQGGPVAHLSEAVARRLHRAELVLSPASLDHVVRFSETQVARCH